MRSKNMDLPLVLFLFASVGLLFLGCTAGDERFTGQEPAGFWYGLFHGAIVVIAFIISLFSDTVRIYEVNNSGALYDLGFVLGILIIGGGGVKAHAGRRLRKHEDAEWDEIARKVELKIMRKLEQCANAPGSDGADDSTEQPAPDAPASPKPDPEWEEIGKKIEQKIKRKLRKWADEE